MSRLKNNKKPLHKSESSNSSEEEKKDEPADDQLNRSFESVASKRGRPTIPDQWTGIIVVEPGDQPIEVKIRPIAPDILLNNAMPLAPRNLRSL